MNLSKIPKKTFLSHFSFIISHLAFCIYLSSCACPHHYTPNSNPPPLPKCHVPEKIKVALVLGGGGAKGLAHIGVLEELENAGVPFDIVIGCSAGSLVGALYCDCPDSQRVKEILEPMRTKWMLDINLWEARFGLSQGLSMRNVLKKELNAKCFEDLKIPLLIVATDLNSGDLVTIGGGPLIPAIQASCAIPFVFVPVDLHGRILVDGGVVDPCPARLARQLGADYVIAVDLGGLLPHTFPTSLFGVAKRSAEITWLWQSECCLSYADIIIRPDLGNTGCFDDDHNVTVYEAGKCAARQAIPQILESIANLPPHTGPAPEIITMEIAPLDPYKANGTTR